MVLIVCLCVNVLVVRLFIDSPLLFFPPFLSVFFDEQHKQVVTPVQFLGRYLLSTQAVIAQRTKAASAVDHSLNDEQQKKKSE